MKTQNSFHQTPNYIVDYVVSLYNTESKIVDLCAGNGALTNSFEIENLVSIDINNNLLKQINQGKKIWANVLKLIGDANNSEEKKIKKKILKEIKDFDYLIMNPPFENYKDFLNVAFSLIKKGGYGIFILPKKTLTEIKWQSIESHKIFDKVDFGTAIVDIVVVKCGYIECYKKTSNKENEISLHCNNSTAKFLKVLSKEIGFKLRETFKSKFLSDDLLTPFEIGKVEWRTNFDINTDNGKSNSYYQVSTFFDEGYTPNLNDIVLQIQQYMQFWEQHFVDCEKGVQRAKFRWYFGDYCEFLINVDIETCNNVLDYLGYEEKILENIRVLVRRFYQDYKLFDMFDKKLWLLYDLLNIDLQQ
jgi:16S rRNA G966 N2-methylase RsmD